MSLRVFCPATGLAAGDPVRLEAEESHYLRRVRRARDGAEIEVIDGAGGLWRARVIDGDARASRVELVEPRRLPTPARDLTLMLGLPEPAATLEVLTQACELGVTAVLLVRCARSQGIAPGWPRIERVLRAAQRQCGRPTAPKITGPMGLAEAIAAPGAGASFVAWEALRGEDDAPPEVPSAARLLVGPEGGLTDDEAAAAIAAGFRPLALGPWTLRSETAALVGLSRLLFAAAPRRGPTDLAIPQPDAT